MRSKIKGVWRRYGLRIWHVYANATGILVIAILISFGLVQTFSGDGAVLERIGAIDNPTRVLKPKGELSYSIDINRKEACPGDVIAKYRRIGAPREVVIESSPLTLDTMAIGVRPTTRVTWVLPDSVGPGKWTYFGIIDSRCPTRKRSDILASFDFEVLPR